MLLLSIFDGVERVGPKVSHFAGGAATASVGMQGEIAAAWNDMVDESKPTTWVVAEYNGSGKILPCFR